MDKKQIFSMALQLPLPDRSELAAILIESFPDNFEEQLADAWDAEIHRRIETSNRGESYWLTQEEVDQRLNAKFGPLDEDNA